MLEELRALFGEAVNEENLAEFERKFVSRTSYEELQRQFSPEWLGLAPAAGCDVEDIGGADGGWSLRLAQAEGVAAIKLKQEAAARGIIV